MEQQHETQSLHLVVDKLYAWISCITPAKKQSSISQLKIFWFKRPILQQIIYIFVATEYYENPGPSITTGAEDLMTSLVKDFKQFVPNPEELVYYEHYALPDEKPTLDRVTAKWDGEKNRFGDSVTWVPIEAIKVSANLEEAILCHLTST